MFVGTNKIWGGGHLQSMVLRRSTRISDVTIMEPPQIQSGGVWKRRPLLWLELLRKGRAGGKKKELGGIPDKGS